jgi:hypothetical protein
VCEDDSTQDAEEVEHRKNSLEQLHEALENVYVKRLYLICCSLFALIRSVQVMRKKESKVLSRPIRAMLMVGVLLFAATLPAPAADPDAQPQAEKPKRPLMTVTHADIQGKVFLASARQGQDEAPAPNVRVQVRDLESDKVLREAFTDKEGYYSLAKLEPAQYLMIIGRLKLQLDVKPEQQPLTELPKVLIVILPEEMTRIRD